MRHKKYSHQTIIGQQGVNIIESIVLKMGFVWHPTNLDAGIDGTIEIRDKESGTATNFLIQVQSKATKSGFKGEDDYKFDYYCKDEDVVYWMTGNYPVLLICVNVEKEEAYWVSVKNYFSDKAKVKSKKITFVKSESRFTESSKDEIADIAIPNDSGFYFTPPLQKENLYSNLIKLKSFPQTIYYADTEYRKGRDLWSDLNDLEDHLGINKSWILKEGHIYSFNDLSKHPWTEIITGDVQQFPTSKWSGSNELSRKADFIQLLNATFESHVYHKGLIRKKTEQFDLFYLKPQLDRHDLPKTLEIKYKRFGRNSHQTVCDRYYRKSDPTILSYFRHLAFEKKSHRFDFEWYLEINPTYLFTHDGFKVHTYYESKLKGKKGLDKAETVFSQVLFWIQILLRDEPMFAKPILEFETLPSIELKRGIDDKLWLKKEDRTTQDILKSDKGLFQ